MDLNGKPPSPVMWKKTIDQTDQHDKYCFQCHQKGEVIGCETCPRVYHAECLGLMILPDRAWLCPECEVTQFSSNRMNSSTRSERYSTDDFQTMLKYTFRQMKSHPQAKSFQRSAISATKSEKFASILHPMDLATIGKHLKEKKYSSADAFIADIKWMLHNTVICHGSQHKLTHVVHEFLSLAYHEISEFKLCSECYLRSIQSTLSDWFSQPCAPPHTLCWAKMNTYQPWPAKLIRIVDDLADVRFFGPHNRAWVPLKQCFVLSKDYPGDEKKKLSQLLKKSLAELQVHIDLLTQRYNYFVYAAPHTPISKTKAFRFVSIINDSILPSYIEVSDINCSSKSTRSCSDTQSNRTNVDIRKPSKRKNDNSDRYISSSKRGRLSSIHIDDDLAHSTYSRTNTSPVPINEPLFYTTDADVELPSTLNTFKKISPGIHQRTTPVRCSSQSDNQLRILALLRKYLDRPSLPIDPIPPDDNQSVARASPNTKVSSTDDRISVENGCFKPLTRHSNLFACSSLDQSFSAALPAIPIRPLSITPPSPLIFEGIPSGTHENGFIQSNITFEPMESEELPSIQSNSSIQFLPNDTNFHGKQCTRETCKSPTLARTSTSYLTSRQSRTVSRENSGLSPLDCCVSPFLSHSSSQHQSHNTAPSRPMPTTSPILNRDFTQMTGDRHYSTPRQIRMMLHNVNNQFQHFIVDFTNQIESFLNMSQLKHEKDLEDIRRSYSLSRNNLHAATIEQIQDIHQTLESQYCTRLSDMRHRYESTLDYPGKPSRV